MDKQKEFKEIEKLKTVKFKEYTVERFKKYWTQEDDYTSKKARVVNAKYIAVYSLWHKRLLVRIFYFEEYMKYKKITRSVFEVQRQLAGMNYKIFTRLYNSGCGQRWRVWTGFDNRGWKTAKADTYQLWTIINNWTGQSVVEFVEYNDPIVYLKQSIHKYSAYEYIPENDQDNNYMFDYLLKYEKHPQLEMIIKMGMPHLINDLGCIRWSKKGIGMLEITKQEICYLQAGINLRAYRTIRNICIKYKLSVEEAELAYELKENQNRYRINFDITHRVISYIKKNDISTHDYCDLIKAKDKLGLPDENKYLFPDNFVEMHDELNVRITVFDSKEQDEKIKKYAKQLMKLSIQKDGIIIRPATSVKELIVEGKKLHHCVGGYAKRMADRETAIMLIREVGRDDTPFVTLELRNNKVIQVRAERNNMPPENVHDFVKKWEKQFQFSGY